MSGRNWIKSWKEGNIGFHLSEINPALLAALEKINIQYDNVFIPLAGKTKDILHFLELEKDVTAVELSPLAIEQFYFENKLAPEKTNKLNFIQSDIFNYRPARKYDLVYDRASMVALPYNIRVKYVEYLKSLLAPNGKILLINIEYDQTKMDGPPFSVTEQEIKEHYSEFDVEVIDLILWDKESMREKFKEKGLKLITQKTILLSLK